MGNCRDFPLREYLAIQARQAELFELMTSMTEELRVLLLALRGYFSFVLNQIVRFDTGLRPLYKANRKHPLERKNEVLNEDTSGASQQQVLDLKLVR